MANELATADAVNRFLYAGDAIVTLQSEATGVHFTYRVSRAEKRDGTPDDRWFVSVLADGDRYVYMGQLFPPERGRIHALRQTRATKIGADAPSWRAFDYLLGGLHLRDAIPPKLVVRHEGRCGRCRRPLTRPDSIDLGIGPDCAERMGLTCAAM